jgi:MFS family permease
MNILSLRGLPLFSTFFLWSFGTAGLHLARPLFAASFGVPLVLVTLITSMSAVAHLIAGPLTGFALDRWGRRPLLILGLIVRGGTTFLEFFADSYLQFLLLEFVGGMGVTMFITGSTVILADLSVVENRGRVVALRSMAGRIGFVSGPVVAGVIAATLDLRWVFMFNAITKLMILVIVLAAIRETRPVPTGEAAGQPEGRQLSLTMFLTRAFVVIALVSFAMQMMNIGVFQSLFPVYLRSQDVFSTSEIGSFITIAAIAHLVVTLPNGILVDRYGRKFTLVPGLGVLALACWLLPGADSYTAVALMAIVYGIGEGACMGAAQAYAMDLAPEHRRGSFLGVWSVVSSGGGALAPVAVGLLAQELGFATAFIVVGGAIAAVGAIMLLFGPDTRARSGIMN